MKLQSMTNLVITQWSIDLKPTQREKIKNYANFLKQPLTLGMFIPTDENGNVLEQPLAGMSGYDHIYKRYSEAKDRVIFEGFKIELDYYGQTKREIVYLPNTKNQVFRKLTYRDGKIETFFFDYYDENKTIEDLVKYNLTITESAVKKYGL